MYVCETLQMWPTFSGLCSGRLLMNPMEGNKPWPLNSARVMLWPTLWESQTESHFRTNTPSHPRVQYLPCKWYSTWSFQPIRSSSQINKLTAMYVFLSNAWFCCSGSRVQLFMLLDEVCDGWFAWFGCSSSGRSRWSVTNDRVVNNHRPRVLLGLGARRGLNWACVAEGGVQLGGDDFPS